MSFSTLFTALFAFTSNLMTRSINTGHVQQYYCVERNGIQINESKCFKTSFSTTFYVNYNLNNLGFAKLR